MESSKSSAPPAGAVDSKSPDVSDSLAASALAALQSDVQPVGHDYVEEVGVAVIAEADQLCPTAPSTDGFVSYIIVGSHPLLNHGVASCCPSTWFNDIIKWSRDKWIVINR